MNTQTIIKQARKYLYNGVQVNPAVDKKYQRVLSELTFLSQHNPDALDDLREEFIGWYLVYLMKRERAQYNAVHSSKIGKYNRSKQ